MSTSDCKKQEHSDGKPLRTYVERRDIVISEVCLWLDMPCPVPAAQYTTFVENLRQLLKSALPEEDWELRESQSPNAYTGIAIDGLDPGNYPNEFAKICDFCSEQMEQLKSSLSS